MAARICSCSGVQAKSMACGAGYKPPRRLGSRLSLWPGSQARASHAAAPLEPLRAAVQPTGLGPVGRPAGSEAMRMSIQHAVVGASIDSAATARDQWQVIDQVAGFELGGAVNAQRHRTMAQSGAAILDRVGADDAWQPEPAADDGLTQASENWLAVTAISERQLEAMSRPDRAGTAHVASKYIGETEKNLHAALAPASAVSAMLQLDEAAALFGRGDDTTASDD
ncbi:MAG TPA: hypothetical protein VI032_17040 [Burkholderiaceae bacterium]